MKNFFVHRLESAGLKKDSYIGIGDSIEIETTERVVGLEKENNLGIEST